MYVSLITSKIKYILIWVLTSCISFCLIILFTSFSPKVSSPFGFIRILCVVRMLKIFFYYMFQIFCYLLLLLLLFMVLLTVYIL